MKKFITLIAVVMLLALTGCAKQETVTPSKTDEKVVKEVVVVLGNDGTLYVPNDDLSGADEVVYKLDDGTEVTITTESDLSVSGEYNAEVSYVKDGETVNQSVLVLSDMQDKINEVISSTPTEPEPTTLLNSSDKKWGDSGYGNVEINGVVYGFDDLGSMDYDTSLVWADAVYGNKRGYTLNVNHRVGITLIAINVFEDMTCEEMKTLSWPLRGEKGYITFNSGESSSSQEKTNSCGL
jgi:hypothetical protein